MGVKKYEIQFILYLGGIMKRVFIFILSFFLLFFVLDPLNLKSEVPKGISIKDDLKENLITLKIENLNSKMLNKLNLDIREITALKNGKRFYYTYKTNSTHEDILNHYILFLKNNNLEEETFYINKNGILIDTITILDSFNNLKTKLKKYDIEVINV